MWSFRAACSLARTTARPVAVGFSTSLLLANDPAHCNDQVVLTKTVAAAFPFAEPLGVGGRCGVSSQHHLPELMVPSPNKTWIPSSSPVVKSTASPELPPPTPDLEAEQAVRQQAEAMQDAPAHVRKDRFLVLEAVRVHGAALRFVDAEFRKDRGVVLEAVRSNGLALEFAAEELRGDRKVVVEAVRETGWALQFASPLLCEDTALQAESDWRTGGY